MIGRPRVAVIGAGHLGEYHCEKLLALGDEGLCTLVGIVDTDPTRREAAAQRFGVVGVACIAELAGAVDSAADSAADSIAAVIIATPTSTHEALGIEALDHGYHVLVEKPLTNDSAAAIHLIDTATKAGLILQVGHSERFNPAVAAALALADRPRYIVAERLGPFTGRASDDDVILDLMIHDLDIVATVIDSPLKEVRAIGVPVLTREVDMAAARLEFEDGAVAQLSAGRASLEPSRKIRFFTIERYLSVDCLRLEVKSVRRLPKEPGSNDRFAEIVAEPVEVRAGDALLAQDRDFLCCIRDGATPLVDGAAGLRALQLCEAVKKELRTPLPEGLPNR